MSVRTARVPTEVRSRARLSRVDAKKGAMHALRSFATRLRKIRRDE